MSSYLSCFSATASLSASGSFAKMTLALILSAKAKDKVWKRAERKNISHQESRTSQSLKTFSYLRTKREFSPNSGWISFLELVWAGHVLLPEPGQIMREPAHDPSLPTEFTPTADRVCAAGVVPPGFPCDQPHKQTKTNWLSESHCYPTL